MNIHLTTKGQDRVLNILRSGGKIVSYFEDRWYNSLCDVDHNTYHIRNDTIRRLENMGFIREYLDTPALGINEWKITRLGIEWLEAVGVPPLQTIE